MRTAGARALDANRLRAPALAIATVGLVLGAIRLIGPFDYGYDFAVYRVAGSAVVHHESLFGPWIGQHLDHPLPFTYPPLAAVFAVPFALVGNHLGYTLWNIASIVALVLVVRAATKPLVRRFASPRLALAVVLALLVGFLITEVGPLSTIQLGRIDAFVPAYATAMLVNDYNHNAAHSAGAVFGVKKLKAIVVYGTQRPPLHDKEKLVEAGLRWRRTRGHWVP